MKTSSFDPYLLGFLLVIIVSSLSAILVGYLSPDSWNYLSLAQSLINKQGCQVDGHYFAIFPCGYPALIALTAWSNSLTALMISSKIANAILLILSYILIRPLFRSPLAALIITISPPTLLISQHTWSENLFLFSLCLSLSQIDSLKNQFKPINFLALCVALVVGISSRYFFAPFAFLLWLCVFWSYGKKVALFTVTAFAFAGAFFVAYYLLNQHLTGFGTGMPRIPAPESIHYLIVKFLKSTTGVAAKIAVVVALAIALSETQKATTSTESEKNLYTPSQKMIVLSGLSFLFLSFILRAFTQYDLYGSRTIGYGVVFTIAGLFDIWLLRRPARHMSLSYVFFTGIVSLSIANASLFKNLVYAAVKEDKLFSTAVEQLRSYKSINSLQNADVVVSFGIPRVGDQIAAMSKLYFGPKTAVITPGATPYAFPESKSHFLKRLSQFSQQQCVVDFTLYSSIEEFKKIIHETYQVGISTQIPRYDPKLADFLLSHFEPNQTVKCEKLTEAARHDSL